MNKFKRFTRTFPMKIYLLLAAIVAVAFFFNDFGLVDIQKTAIVLAAGIDRTEEGVTLTADIAVPKGSDRTTGGASCVAIEAEGKTVSDCVSRIYSETGWVPKLIFCQLVVLGEETAKEDVMAFLDFFLRNEYLNKSCLVAVCEGTAKELLSSVSAIDDSSSTAINTLFSDAAEKSGKVMKNTLREFAIGYYGVSESGYMPFLHTIEQDAAAGSGDTENGGSGGGNGGSGGSEPAVLYSAEKTAIFHKGKMTGVLPLEQTFAFSLVKGNVFSGTFLAEENGKPVSLNILKNKGGVSLSFDPVPKAEISVELTVRLFNRSETAPIEDVAAQDVSEELRKNAEEVIGGYLNDLLTSCREAKCDLFGLRRDLYRSSLSRYGEWKDSVPDRIETVLKTTVNGMR